jgi:hypothetical protein
MKRLDGTVTESVFSSVLPRHRLAEVAVACLAATFVLGSGGTAAGACADDAQRYWKSFRDAAIRGKSDIVANLSTFPFEVRGTLDESPTRRLPRAEFLKVWPRLLRSDPGLTPTPTTMKAFVKHSSRLEETSCTTGSDQFRVGNWLFKLQPEGWRFVTAFVDD